MSKPDLSFSSGRGGHLKKVLIFDQSRGFPSIFMQKEAEAVTRRQMIEKNVFFTAVFYNIIG